MYVLIVIAASKISYGNFRGPLKKKKILNSDSISDKTTSLEDRYWQAFIFTFKGAQQFPSGKKHPYIVTNYFRM